MNVVARATISLTFVASVGPGYNDEGIRPWNAHNTKSRADGAYYDNMWRQAIDAGARYVSITSFNECVVTPAN